MSGPRILLVATDLLVGSRIAGLARECDAVVEQRAVIDAAGGPFDLVVVDLQAARAEPGDVVARLRAALPVDRRTPIVAFAPHVATELLAAARAAGVEAAVSRGELLGSFAAIVRRACG